MKNDFVKPHHVEWLTVDWIGDLNAELLSRAEFNKLFQIRQALNERKFYTYILWRVDLGKPVPFYVGKGVNRRAAQHTAPSENQNLRKSNILNDHRERGLEILTSVPETFDDEEDAYEAEIELITFIGRKELNAGPLANRTDGGDGTRGHVARRGGDSASARAVVVDGVTYSSLTEAADTTGVTAGAIAHRINCGWPGHYYEDEGQRPEKEGLLFRYKKPVTVPSGQFESLSGAAKATGEPFRKIFKRIGYGWKGYYYTEEGQRPRISRFKPCRIDGVEYPSHLAAVEALELGLGSLQKRLRSSNYPSYEDLTGTIETVEKNPLNHVRTWVDGAEFSTASDAARFLGIEPATLIHQLKSSNFPDRIGEGVEKENRNAKMAKLTVPIKIRGVEYSSLSEASRADGIDINTLKKRCKSPSEPDYTSADPDLAVVQPKDGKPAKIQVVIDNVTYKSVNMAQKATGVARETIKRRLDDPAWPNYQRLYG